MHRREAIRSLAAVAALPFMPAEAGSAMAFGEALHGRLDKTQQFRTLSASQQRLVSDLVDRILPATDTPGALDVRVPEFIDLLLTEWYDAADRDRFLAHLNDIDERARTQAGAGFADLTEPRKQAMLSALDSARDDGEGAGWAFGQIKSLAIYGYFTSETVSRDVLQTQTFFAQYDGCAPVTN